VIAESVNPLAVTRDSWLDVAENAGTVAVEVEVVPWNRDHVMIDTAGESPNQSLRRLLRQLDPRRLT
jgi:hypothetical protein